MSKNLNESPVIRRNEEYIERLEKRKEKLRDRVESYRRDWSSDEPVYRHRTTNRRMSEEKYKQLQQEYYDLHRKLINVRGRENERVASKVVPYITAFIVMDKRQNPDSYPDWLSLKIDDEMYGSTIRLQPYIDLEKLLEEKGDLRKIAEIYHRISRFVDRYFTDTARIDLRPKVFSGIDDYIKNVFRKQIRPRIMNEVEDSECIHSIVFRVKGNYRKDIQIHPRFKDSYNCRWSSRSRIQRDLKNILKEYGWVEGRNYTDDTSRD
jgi:hypothetical protein